MADYQPLLARAVAALSDKSPSMRRAVYNRARDALLQQLRSLDPPLSEADIARERLALDDAINQIEAEHARVGAPGAARPAPAKAPAFALPPAPDDEEPASVPARDERPGPAPRWLSRPDHGPGSAPAFPPDPSGSRPEPPPAPFGSTDRRDEWPEPSRFPPDAGPRVPPAAFSLPERKRAPAFDDLVVTGRDEAGDDVPAETASRDRPRIDTVPQRHARAGRGRSIVLGGVVLVVVGTIAGVNIWLKDQPAPVPAQPPLIEAPRPPEGEGKIAGRVGGAERAPAPAPAPAPPPSTPRANEVAVAQRAIFYEENPANPQTPKATAGRVVWRLDAVNAGQGQPLETAVRAAVEVPESGLTLNLLVRRNTDATLPASHTIELQFQTPADRTVRDIGAPALKNEESTRGAPLAGLPVPVRENLFLIGLSNLPNDVERNKDLLLRRNWIDVPIRLANGQRSILSFEKGISGDQVLAEAFRQWEGGGTR